MKTTQTGYTTLLQRFSAVHKKELRYKLITVLNKIIIALCLLLGLAAGIELLANGDIPFRTFMYYSGTTIFTMFAAYSIIPVLLQYFGIRDTFNPHTIAKRIGNAFPDIRDTLLNAFQLAGNEYQHGSHDFIEAAFDTAFGSSREKDFFVIVEKKEMQRFALFCAITVIILSGLFAIPAYRQSLGRVFNYNTSYLPPAPFALSVTPMHDKKLRGEKAEIHIRIKGTPPAKVILKIRELQQKNFDSHEIKPDANGHWTYSVSSLTNSIEYFAESAWLSSAVTSEIGAITVSDKPLLKSLSGKVYSPLYTQQPAITLHEDAADIVTLRGSVTDMEILANKQLNRSTIILLTPRNDSSGIAFDTLRKEMSVNGRRASGKFTVLSSGEYYIELLDTDGLKNDSPIHYKIIAQTDNSPAISLITPQNDVTVDASAMLPIKIAADDDYGFTILTLNYRLAESKYGKKTDQFTAIRIPISQKEKSVTVPYLWDITKIGISPSDKYEFYCEVFDNDNISGPKSAKTQTISVKLPSLDEVLDDSGKQQEEIRKDLEEIAKQAEQSQKEMEKLQRDLRKDKQMDWQDKKKMEDALQQQKDLQKKMEEVAQKIDDMSKKLQDNNAISKETLDKYQELQKLMKEVNSPELQKAMERMQQAMQQMSPQQMQEAMKQYQFNEEQFKKQIERSLNIMKRLKAEQLTDALTKRAEQLEKKINELQKQTENTNANDQQRKNDLAEKQKDAGDEAKDIKKDLQDLENLMKDIKQNMPMDKLEEAKQEFGDEKNDIAEQMEEAAEEMEKGQQEKSSQKQKAASQKAKSFAQKMKSLKKEMNKNLSKEVMKQMQKSVSDLLDLSQKQEQLRKNSQQLDPNSAQYTQNAQEQKKIQEQLNNVAQRMSDISQKSMAMTPEMAKNIGDAMQKMQQSGEQLSNRNGQQAAQQQSQAMSSMNKAAMQMQEAMQAMKNQGDGGEGSEGENGEGDGKGKGKGGKTPGGFMQKLQQMAGQQQQINQGMQRLQPGQGGEMSMQQQSELGRLAAQQGKAMQAMQELAKEQKEQSGGGKKALGSLDRIAQEMKEVMTDMETGSITDETIKRQDKILSRLLDATLSMNERDYEKKRESKSGTDMQRKSPDQLNINGLKANNGNTPQENQIQFTKDYEQIIRMYFEQLNKQVNSEVK